MRLKETRARLRISRILSHLTEAARSMRALVKAIIIRCQRTEEVDVMSHLTITLTIISISTTALIKASYTIIIHLLTFQFVLKDSNYVPGGSSGYGASSRTETGYGSSHHHGHHHHQRNYHESNHE